MNNSTSAANLTALAIGIAFFFLYALTAAPSIVELYDDSLEFQLVGPTLGIAHPTGYPLYTLLGGLWSRLLFPLGNWAWRMNLLSALAAAATVAVIFLLTQVFVNRILHTKTQNPQRPLPGIFAAIAFGLGPIWWSQATVAEVYTLHNLLIVLVLLQTIWLANTDVASAAALQRGTVLALTISIGLTHHRTIVLLLPGLLILLARQR